MKRILRVASYPTIEESGRGLHCYELSNDNKFEIIYLTWFKKNAIPFDIPTKTKKYVRTFASYEVNEELFSDRNVFPRSCIIKMEKISEK